MISTGKIMSFLFGWIRRAVYLTPLDRATQETILEVLRWLIFIAMSAIVGELLGLITQMQPTTVTVVLTPILRAMDKWLYNHQKRAPDILTGEKEPHGLSGF